MWTVTRYDFLKGPWEPPTLPYQPKILRAIREQPDGWNSIVPSVSSIYCLGDCGLRARQGRGDSLFRAAGYLDRGEREGPGAWFAVIVVVCVEWEYFDAAAKGGVVAGREVLWWDARHDRAMMAKLSSSSADGALQLQHPARQQARMYLK